MSKKSIRPNIILITIDCWRYDRLGAQTKNLQALAETGVSFQQAYTNGGWTQAAFPALLSSTYPSMYDGCLGPLSDERPYLPQWLKEQGYQTFAVQTSPLLEKNFGYGRGMDNLAGLRPPWQAPPWYRTKGIQHFLRLSPFHQLLRAANIDARPVPVYANAEEATSKAIEMLQDVSEPYFLWVHYMDAHWPYFDQEGHDTAQALAQSWQDRQLVHQSVRGKDHPHPGPEAVSRWMKMFDAAVQKIDGEIGRLLEAVNQHTGENVLTIVTGDHGEEFYEHGNIGHNVSNMHEELIHVPLIMTHPQLPTHKRISQPVALLDIAPTIIDLLEKEAPKKMLGESILPLIEDEESIERRNKPIISECPWRDGVHFITIRAGAYKYMVELKKPENWRLYNLENDPNEQNDLSKNPPENLPDFPAILAEHLVLVRSSKINEANTLEIDDDLTDRLRELGYID